MFDRSSRKYGDIWSGGKIFGGVERSASEEVVLHLIKVKCLPVLFYGTDACPTNTTDLHSLEFTVKRVTINNFVPTINTVISSCMSFFGSLQ